MWKWVCLFWLVASIGIEIFLLSGSSYLFDFWLSFFTLLKYGDTALMKAIDGGQNETAAMLLKAGADVNAARTVGKDDCSCTTTWAV